LNAVGYERIKIGEFLAALPAHAIAPVVDVHELPLSRKRGFSKKSLATHLELNGVRYNHMPARGCPRAI